MLKSELIQQLNQINGNPVVLIKVDDEWTEATAIISTGEHRNGITLSIADPAEIDYLGPVP